MGSVFKIYLSQADEPLEEASEGLPGTKLLGGGERILVVELEDLAKNPEGIGSLIALSFLFLFLTRRFPSDIMAYFRRQR